MNPQRVVITGLGAITPLGRDRAETWAGLVAGRSGIGPISFFDAPDMGLEVGVAAELKDFDPEPIISKRDARRMDRVTQIAICCTHEALRDAGLLDAETGQLDPKLAAPERTGTYIGTGVGGIGSTIEQQNMLRDRGARRVSPFTIPMLLCDSIPGSVAIHFGLKGANMAHLSACASGANAIGEAAEAIRRGAVDVMVSGASEAGITPLGVAGFQNMGALSKWSGDPTQASRPFDRERDGFVIGEGAGVLILESLEHAQARGARIHAELVGYGSTADALHITAPAEGGEGILRAIDAALNQAGLDADAIDYVNAHGTSTPLNDVTETRAMRTLFGARAMDVPVASIKSMIGHLLGASGAVAAVSSVMSIVEGVIPPTINLHTPDPECDLDYVPHTARRPEGGIDVVLSNALGFGGHNAALLFRRF